MIIELAHFALILALVLSFFGGILPLWGSFKAQTAWLNLSFSATLSVAALVSLSFLILGYAFASNDFSVLYVANNSGRDLPLFYKLAAIWGGHEGSLLLWILLLTLWSTAFVFFSKKLPFLFRARVLSILLILSFGFLLFILATSNPFERVLPMPLNGRDLNPLLQDIGMIIHPPLLYMGYVGFAIAFAFALSALISGELNTAWAKNSRPWTLIAWIFLSLGIAVGAWWAYFELGWGGWWFWDPVENASLMPWIIGTALLHSLSVTEKRGSFKNWSVLLAISAFSLSLLGTFLVRSGVLTSVHAFATDPRRGIFILIFLALVIGISLFLFAYRAPKVGLGARFSFLSRESFLLQGNILLVIAASVVLLGTLYPLIIDAFNLGKISVGPPYFNAVFVPIALPIFLLMAISPFLRWRQSCLFFKKHIAPFVLAIFSAVLLLAYFESFLFLPFVALLLSFWIIFSALFQLSERFIKTAHLSFSFLGMHIAHIGVAIFVIGVCIVSNFSFEKNLVLTVENRTEIADFSVVFENLSRHQGPNYSSAKGTFLLKKNGTTLAKLYPEKRTYTTSMMPMTESAVDSTFWRDIYIALAEPVEMENPQSAWVVRLYYKPFMAWLWLGAFLMALGGFIAFMGQNKK